jgi:hypothetical protein
MGIAVAASALVISVFTLDVVPGVSWVNPVGASGGTPTSANQYCLPYPALVWQSNPAELGLNSLRRRLECLPSPRSLFLQRLLHGFQL